MADPSTYPETGDDSGGQSDGRSTTGTPLWVKLSGITAIVLILGLVVVLHLTGILGPGGH